MIYFSNFTIICNLYTYILRFDAYYFTLKASIRSLRLCEVKMDPFFLKKYRLLL